MKTKTTLEQLAAKLCEKWRGEASKVDPYDDYYTTNECAAADQKEVCADELEAAIAEHQAAPAEQQWQPIETAPKDGGFIVWDATENRRAICEMKKWASGHLMPTEYGGYLMPNPILWTAAPNPPKP